VNPGGDWHESRTYFLGLLVVLSFLTVALPSALLGIVVFQVAVWLGLTPRAAFAAALLYAVGTNALSYSNLFVAHQLVGSLLFGAFAVLFGVRRGAIGARWEIGAGALMGYECISEYPAALACLPLLIYAWRGRPEAGGSLIRVLAGVVPPVLLLVAYDVVSFGTPLPVGYFYSTLWSDVHREGVVSLTYPQWEPFWGVTFGVHRGLFFLSPWLLLAIAGYAHLLRRRSLRAELWVLATVPALFLLFNASSAMWQGGFAVGPRYLVPSLPFLGLAAGIGLERVWRILWLRPLAAAAITWSLFNVWTQTFGGQSFPDYTPNPLFDFSLPKLLAGDVARNAGMLLGLTSFASLVPLIIILACIAVLGMRSTRKRSLAEQATR
jgi:hypothetical protein